VVVFEFTDEKKKEDCGVIKYCSSCSAAAPATVDRVLVATFRFLAGY